MEKWWARHQVLGKRFATPATHALVAGFIADRLGFAFASAYQAAARALFVGLEPAALVALAATEEGGVHPKAILTGLRPSEGGFRIDGNKSFITLGPHATDLLVVLRQGLDRETRKPRLAVARVPVGGHGLTLTALPPTPFAPEIPHAAAQFGGVPITKQAFFEGDGYSDYLKPFRTVEDCFVHTALLGYLFQVARRAGWPIAIRDELLTLSVAALKLCEADPKQAPVHVALAALMGQTRQLLRRLGAPYWDRVDEPTRTRWERDKPLLDVAGKVRAQRLTRAQERLGIA